MPSIFKWHNALSSRHLIVTYLRTKPSPISQNFNLEHLAKHNLTEYIKIDYNYLRICSESNKGRTRDVS